MLNNIEKDRIIQEITQESKKISPLYDNEITLFKTINFLDKTQLDKLFQKYNSPNRLSHQQTHIASAANIIRFMIICYLREGKEISAQVIENLKNAFIRKQTTIFAPYLPEDILNKINRYEKPNPFNTLWNNYFSLLHPLVIDPNTYNNMKALAQALLEDLTLKNFCRSMIVDFTGSRNEGGKIAWLSLFPSTFKKHTQAYRLTITFANGQAKVFLDLGGEANSGNPSEFINIHEVSVSSYPEILKQFQNWKKEFLQRNKQLQATSTKSLHKNIEEEYHTQDKLIFPLNQILFGPPGTGKTYHTVTKAVEIIDGQAPEDYALAKQRFDKLKQEGKIKFITFHQNYSYEDFMVGIRPVLNGTNIAYELHEGPFKQIADKARKDSTSNYVLIIDEINRGNISKIFGELITLIENDKRAGNKHAISMPLMYHKNGDEEFSVPNNLYIIGTMNTADKSIALVDIALRRRFIFEEMMPNSALLEKIENFDLPRWFSWLNTKITAELDRNYQIGHSYFIGLKSTAELQQVFYQCILPLLKEYFYGRPDKLKEIIPGIELDEKLPGTQLVQLLDKALHNETDKN